MLHEARSKYGKGLYLGPSFPAIVGAGPNGAIVHYRPEEGSDLKVKSAATPLLIDTGGHYLNGTTDTTRTMIFEDLTNSHINQDNELHDLKEMYTRVLMGNLDLESVKFPSSSKITGHLLEPMARRHLWQADRDFSHSVGHGVSHCGPVHEYPHYAFARSAKMATPLAPGMVLTNEPGYYKTNAYGIRIENILKVVQKTEQSYGFSNLTLVPYCKELIA